jgi:NAD(P)H dehydrogenase (quinone)
LRVLVVYCHPDPSSFAASVRDVAIAAMEDAGHETRVIDLYAEGFDPAMSREEWRGYHTRDANEAPVAAHLDALRWCEGLVFVYPTWWYAPPAMLKGWLDRVWVPHATFSMPQDGKPIGRVLTNIRMIGVVTTLGSPWWWWTLMGMPGRRIFLTGIAALCAPRARRIWLALHDMDSIDAAARGAFLERVRRRFTRL